MTHRSNLVAAVLLFFISLFAVGAVTFWRLSTQPEAVEPRLLYETVLRHLESCRAYDFHRAYSSASANLHRRTSLSEFEAGVLLDPAQVDRRMRVEFGATMITNTLAVVEVFFIDRVGGAYPRVYLLRPEAGEWRIQSVEARADWIDGTGIRGTRI